MIKIFRQFYKFAGFIFLVVTFVLSASIVKLAVRNLDRRRKLLAQLISLHSMLCLKLFSVQIINSNQFKNGRSAHLYVSNHLSYLDILILSSQTPCSFVTSIEVKGMPFLGQLSELGGCLYVERRSRDNLNHEISDITDALAAGLNVCIFPEATSTNGESVLRFRRPLYNAAIRSCTPVVPVCINYLTIDGHLVSPSNRDKVFWYGDMGFLGHLFELLSCRKIQVDVQYEAKVSTGEHTTAQDLAELTHSVISRAFQPVLNTI